jgi:hypothetical protein
MDHPGYEQNWLLDREKLKFMNPTGMMRYYSMGSFAALYSS